MQATKEREEDCLAAYLAIPGQIDLQGFGIILEAKRSHSEKDVLAVDSLALLLLALLGRWIRGSAQTYSVRGVTATDLRW